LNLLPSATRPEQRPNFICVGAEKSGSTALYDCLRAHADIYMSPIKEPNFFSTDVRVENFREDYLRHEQQKGVSIDDYFDQPRLPDRWGAYLESPEHYLRLFAEGTAAEARGEVSNSYLYSTEAARNIADSLPAVRILVILREPVARAFSHYRAMVRDGRTAKDSLMEEVAYDDGFADRRWGSCHGYIDHGLYGEQLERLFAVFPREQVKVILAEEFFAERERVMAEVFRFLELPTDAAQHPLLNRNRSAVPRSAGLIRWLTRTGLKSKAIRAVPSPLRERVKGMFYTPVRVEMTAAERDFLTPFFAKDLQRLEAILHRPLTPWHRGSE